MQVLSSLDLWNSELHQAIRKSSVSNLDINVLSTAQGHLRSMDTTAMLHYICRLPYCRNNSGAERCVCVRGEGGKLTFMHIYYLNVHAYIYITLTFMHITLTFMHIYYLNVHTYITLTFMDIYYLNVHIYYLNVHGYILP